MAALSLPGAAPAGKGGLPLATSYNGACLRRGPSLAASRSRTCALPYFLSILFDKRWNPEFSSWCLPMRFVSRRLAAGGFTLLEVLVVVVVIGILIGIALVGFSRVQERSHLATLQSDLRNYATAQALYVSEGEAYAASPAELPGYALSQSVKTLSSHHEGASRWRLSLGHEKTEWRCAMQGGPTAVGPESKAPVCAKGNTIEVSVSDSEPDAGQTVTFDATLAIAQVAFSPSEGEWRQAFAAEPVEIQSVRWDFGDGEGSVGPPETHTRVSHTYALPGTYTALLTLTKRDGGESSGRKVMMVRNEAPSAQFVITGSGLDFSFDAGQSTDREGHTLTYAWDFGDGSVQAPQMLASASHHYTEGNTFIVKLTVDDGHGGVATSAQSLTSNAPPVARFTYSPAEPEAGDPITFNGSTSSDPEGTSLSYAWDYGSVGAGTGVTHSQVFPEGDHLVSLRVTDGAGFQHTSEQVVKVVQYPTAHIVAPAAETRAAGHVATHTWTVTNKSAKSRTLTLTLQPTAPMSAVFYGGTLVTQEVTFQGGETKSFQITSTVSSSALSGEQGKVVLEAKKPNGEFSVGIYTVTVQ